MERKPTHEEIKQRIKKLEQEAEKIKQTKKALRLNESRLEALLQLNQMTEAPLQEITDFALEEAIKLTQSNIGYLAFMNEDETVLTMHSWSKNAMKQCVMKDKPNIYPIETTGLWGEVVRQRKPIITNDYPAPNPLKKGYPEGHVNVIRHMNIPVFDGDRIVAVAGVGNKKEEYNESDIRQLALLMQGMWRLIEHKWTSWELKESEAKFRKLVETVGSAIFIYRDKKIRFANPAAEVITGYSPKELLSSDFLDLIHPNYQGLVQDKAFSFHPFEEIHFRHEVKILNKKSGEGWFDLTVLTIEYEGQSALLCVAYDVTNRKELEENLRREKSQLEEMNITLRNVMKNINYESQELQKAIAKKVRDLLLPAFNKIEKESDPEVCKGYFDIIRDQLISLSTGTNAKPDANMLKLTPTEMKICQFIQAGSTTKDIAQAMCLSVDTIQTHRKNVRKKLGLSGRKVNLFTFLKARDSNLYQSHLDL